MEGKDAVVDEPGGAEDPLAVGGGGGGREFEASAHNAPVGGGSFRCATWRCRKKGDVQEKKRRAPKINSPGWRLPRVNSIADLGNRNVGAISTAILRWQPWSLNPWARPAAQCMAAQSLSRNPRAVRHNWTALEHGVCTLRPSLSCPAAHRQTGREPHQLIICRMPPPRPDALS